MSNEKLNNIKGQNASSTSSDPCCGPFKRGKPGIATDPRMQCFADCCNICPPDDCCESITIHFECGCPPPSDLACECSSTSYNFGGIKFKRKKRKLPEIPKFSQESQNENGFIFAQAGTVPTPVPTSTPTPTETPYTTPTPTTTETPTPTPTPTCSEPCSKIQVTLTTTGCCLYLGPGGVEAVGGGIITAEMSGSRDTCELMLLLNGQTGNTVLVEDGESITVEIQTNGDCECCETQKDCNNSQSSANIWSAKNKSLVLNRDLMIQKIKSVARKVKN